MTAANKPPYYQKTARRTNDPAFQISQLVRSGSDARRLLVPILAWADLAGKLELAEEIDSVLQAWDDPAFADRADRAQEILDDLNTLWAAGNSVDMMDLGERRVPLYALSLVIDQRREHLVQADKRFA